MTVTVTVTVTVTASTELQNILAGSEFGKV